MEDKEIIQLLIERLLEEGCWFTTKKDPTPKEPAYYYKLDQYGDLTEEAQEKVAQEIKDYIGDGAIDIEDAIGLWLHDNINECRVSYEDLLVTKFELKPVIDQIEAYDEVGKVEENKQLKRENYKTRIEEENTKSLNLISSMFTDNNFDSDSPEGQIVMRTSELFNVLSDKGYDVQVAFDNGESTNTILLGNQGGQAVITITNNTEPLRAFTSGSFEINEDNLNTLNDIKSQIETL